VSKQSDDGTRLSSERARADYVARINRVQDHIEAHLDEPLPLESLARVACFSVYHFHRIYRGVTGEPVDAAIARSAKRIARSVNLIASPATQWTSQRHMLGSRVAT